MRLLQPIASPVRFRLLVEFTVILSIAWSMVQVSHAEGETETTTALVTDGDILSRLPYEDNSPPANETTTTTTTTATVEPPGAPEIREQFFLGGKCAAKSTCHQRGRRLELDGGSGADKRSCYCDEQCSLYDDCCLDSAYSRPMKKRLELGLEQVRWARKQWHCHRVNRIFGDILMRATCPQEWLDRQTNGELAHLVKRRCEYVKDRGKRLNTDYQTDPVGMMMPITDLASGITYANSYCLRCNLFNASKLQAASNSTQQPPTTTTTTTTQQPAKPQTRSRRRSRRRQQSQQQQQETKPPSARPKLIYWSPLLTCNYNLETDERNTLYDLISANKGQALKYSSKRNKWIINASSSSSASAAGVATQASNTSDHQQQHDEDELRSERVCSIAPTIPDSVEHIIRYCRLNTIDSCPESRSPDRELNQTAAEYWAWRRECHFGHQLLTYSQTSGAIYFNLACARCNHERQVFCEPKLAKDLHGPPGVAKAPAGETGTAPETTRILSAPGEDLSTQDRDEEEEAEAEGATGVPMGPFSKELARGGAALDSTKTTAFSGSFSILIDLYGSSQGDEQVGAIHQCPDSDSQFYDPFHNACRDILCGLNQRRAPDGSCADIKPAESPEVAQRLTRVDVVDKFKPAMAYLTAVCLVISIASLSMYLALYCLSMFDLRPLVVAMAAAAADRRSTHHPLEKHRSSKSSSTGSLGGGSRGSHSLSSRGVACLASSLLAAYLCFILGHQPSLSTTATTTTADQAAHTTNQSAHHNSHSDHQQRPVGLTCLGLALATYYCFLVAFCWMFLLSYDIWRTLRLATCQLRGPAMHSQSKRFLSYTLFSLLVSGLIVGASVLVDRTPFECQAANQQLVRGDHHHHLTSPNCSRFQWEVSEFIHLYRPKFGHRAGSCWFSNRRALALFFGLPVALIMFLNLLFFLHSSCMVIRTSSRSSRYNQSTSSASPAAVISTQNDSSSSPATESCSDSSTADYMHQNSLTTNSFMSVQTLESQLSNCTSNESSCLDADSSSNCSRTLSTEGATQPDKQQPAAGDNLDQKRVQPAASKNDSKLQHLGTIMGRVVKDYRLYYRLSTIMGLTWLTGLIASVVDHSDALWYLFVVLNTLQGLFIFIAFGCKSSKLANLEILLAYLRFRWCRTTETEAAQIGDCH